MWESFEPASADNITDCIKQALAKDSCDEATPSDCALAEMQRVSASEKTAAACARTTNKCAEALHGEPACSLAMSILKLKITSDYLECLELECGECIDNCEDDAQAVRFDGCKLFLGRWADVIEMP